MDEHASGIVLQGHSYSETSLIVRWITLEQGRLDTIARGARRPKSPLRGKLDLFFFADFTFARSRRSQLHTLRELQLRETFPALRSDLSRLRLASYASALIHQSTEPGPPLPEIFGLFHTFLRHLARQHPAPLLPLAFELKLLAALGLGPGANELRLSPAVRRLAEACLALDWPQLGAPPPAEISELDAALEPFLVFHLGRVPHQRKEALASSRPHPGQPAK